MEQRTDSAPLTQAHRAAVGRAIRLVEEANSRNRFNMRCWVEEGLGLDSTIHDRLKRSGGNDPRHSPGVSWDSGAVEYCFDGTVTEMEYSRTLEEELTLNECGTSGCLAGLMFLEDVSHVIVEGVVEARIRETVIYDPEWDVDYDPDTCPDEPVRESELVYSNVCDTDYPIYVMNDGDMIGACEIDEMAPDLAQGKLGMSDNVAGTVFNLDEADVIPLLHAVLEENNWSEALLLQGHWDRGGN